MVSMRDIRSDWIEYCADDEESDAYKDYAAAGALFDAALNEHDAEVRKVERIAAFDEGMYALGDTIGVDPEWYDRILRPSEEY